jgi:hypothetical protein
MKFLLQFCNMGEHYLVSYGLSETASVTVDKTFMFRVE